MTKISVVTPVLNECPWIGYSIMAAIPYMHEFIYLLDEKSNDGTRELLHHIEDTYAHEKLVIVEYPNFHPHDMKAYNASFNYGISLMTGNAAIFLHPDMIITDGPKDGIPDGPLAWWTQMTSYGGDFNTVISKGRCDKWKNIHSKKFGLHYFGEYGSQNEDFYHKDITGNAYKHYGPEFSKYPFQVAESGIKISHFCENKDYARRFEKMKLCLKTLYPKAAPEDIAAMAAQHPRVTLEKSSRAFGNFEFTKATEPIPEVFEKYKEFESFKKEPINV